jgi:hypothetical protein
MALLTLLSVATEEVPTEKERVPIEFAQVGTLVSEVVTGTVPEHVAELLDESTAVVGGVVALTPPSARVSGVPSAIVFVPVKTTVAVAPVEPLLNVVRLQVPPAAPTVVLARTDATFTVPEQVAVPLESVAVVGAALAPEPPFTKTKGVPLAIAFAPVKATVAEAPEEPLLKPLTWQVCPSVPWIDPPDV